MTTARDIALGAAMATIQGMQETPPGRRTAEQWDAWRAAVMLVLDTGPQAVTSLARAFKVDVAGCDPREARDRCVAEVDRRWVLCRMGALLMTGAT